MFGGGRGRRIAHRPGRCQTSMSGVRRGPAVADRARPGAMSDVDVGCSARAGGSGSCAARGDVGRQCRMFGEGRRWRIVRGPGRCRTSMSHVRRGPAVADSASPGAMSDVDVGCPGEADSAPPGAMSDVDVGCPAGSGGGGSCAARGDTGRRCRVFGEAWRISPGFRRLNSSTPGLRFLCDGWSRNPRPLCRFQRRHAIS